MKSTRIALAALVVASSGLAACNSNVKQSASSSTTAVSVADTTRSTDVSTTAPSPAAETTLPNHALWDQVAFPEGVGPDGTHTAPVPETGVLPDGVYWTIYTGGGQQTPDSTVMQAFFGAECESQAAASGDECLNGIFVPTAPARNITDLPFHDNVYITVSDVTTQLSYWITPAELVAIRSGGTSAGAPSSFDFTPLAWFMTVKDGQITKFEQVWTP